VPNSGFNDIGELVIAAGWLLRWNHGIRGLRAVTSPVTFADHPVEVTN
jgi:hypothetical protein